MRDSLSLRSCAMLLLGFLWAGATMAAPMILFDDFNYRTRDELAAHGWIIRTVSGLPGVTGAQWDPGSVTFADDPAKHGNRLLRMTSSTDGSAGNTHQTQLCHQRKYLEGTYAARIRLTDAPGSGPTGDQVVETFYMVSPLKAPMDPDFSEMDVEYLPNGGWRHTGPTLFTTTWETFNPEPWQADNVSANRAGAVGGWHTLVVTVAGGEVRYFIDGELLAAHGDRFYPESFMSINFNLWFIRDGLLSTSEPRQYAEEIDWVLFEREKLLSPVQVNREVEKLRRKKIHFKDTVPALIPPLSSPCNF